MNSRYQKALRYLQNQFQDRPKLALILGSGLGDFIHRLKNAKSVTTSAIPGYPRSTVQGHEGVWSIGSLGRCRVLVLGGRVHLYEGYSMEDVTLPIKLIAGLGVTNLIITNAAGGLNPNLKSGDLMVIDDHINLTFDNPLMTSDALPPEERFIDLSEPYDQNLIRIAEGVALELGIRLKKGILAVTKGPSYETAAEVRMMQRMGGDAGSMSTVPEVIVANQLNIRVLGISCITNQATGISESKLDHSEVTEVAARVSKTFEKLVNGIVNRVYEDLAKV